MNYTVKIALEVHMNIIMCKWTPTTYLLRYQQNCEWYRYLFETYTL